MFRRDPDPRSRYTRCDLLKVVVVASLLLLTSVLDRFELMPRPRPPP